MWTTRASMTARLATKVRSMASTVSGVITVGTEPHRARARNPLPSFRKINASLASHSRAARSATVMRTGSTSVGELAITRRISLVAVCCSSASARRLSRSRTLEPSFLSDLRAAAGLPLALDFVGFAPRRIVISLFSRAITTASRATTG